MNEEKTAVTTQEHRTIWQIFKKAVAEIIAWLFILWLLVWLPVKYVSRWFVDDPRPEPLMITMTSPEVCADILNPEKKATVSFDYSNCAFCFIDLNGEQHTPLSMESVFRISTFDWVDMRKEAEGYFEWRTLTTGHFRSKKTHPHIWIDDWWTEPDYRITVYVHAFAHSDGHLLPTSYADAVWESADDDGIIMTGRITVADTTGTIVEIIDVPRLRGPRPRLTRRMKQEKIIRRELTDLYELLQKNFILAHEQAQLQ